MDLINAVLTSEEKYLSALESFFISVWGDTFLVSHGLDHHRRVWRYARELIEQAEPYLPFTDKLFTDKLIIASYLHDLGMAVDQGTEHGIKSAIVCRQFLRELNLTESDFTDLIEAIESHDRKQYDKFIGKRDLLSFLCVADDLDALGFTGIYRYIEIFIARGKGIGEMCRIIPANAAGRFRHFISMFGFSKPLVRKHQKRYQVVEFFFNEFTTGHKKGVSDLLISDACDEVVMRISQAYEKKIYPENLISQALKESDNGTVRWFFSNLEKELIRD